MYGVVQAKVSIGYQHSTCEDPVWETQTADIKGFDVDISDIGGWGLDIHHHYNFHEGKYNNINNRRFTEPGLFDFTVLE